jgi:hypothetical protein
MLWSSRTHFGWRHDPAGISRAVNRYGRFRDRGAKVIRSYKQVDTFLSDYLIWANPQWKRGAQGIGDCGSWAGELVATTLIAMMAHARRNRALFCEAATESLYGLSRVEVEGKTHDDWEDGTTGFRIAEALTDFGVTLRKDYSLETGNPDHDLRIYNAERAKQWGYHGCGGERDKGKLDAIAKLHPARDKAQVRGFEDVAASIAGAKCPVFFCSDYGCSMKRDKYGYCARTKTWYHAMAALDVRFGSHPGVRVFQSWGPDVVSGPSGDEYCDRSHPTPPAILGTSWWLTPREVDKMCQGWDDSWAISPIQGFEIPTVDAGEVWS